MTIIFKKILGSFKKYVDLKKGLNRLSLTTQSNSYLTLRITDSLGPFLVHIIHDTDIIISLSNLTLNISKKELFLLFKQK